MELKDYSENFYHLSHQIPKLLDSFIRLHPQVRRVVDIGCGDGSLLLALRANFHKLDLTGVDLSPERIKRLGEQDSSIKSYTSDASHLNGLDGKQFDLVISSQVIEHVPSDDKMLQEMARLTDKDGALYISSVIKKWYGWWIYKCNGVVTCDPTHIREYRSRKEFLDLVERNGFRVIDSKVRPFLSSVFHFILRALVRKKVLSYLSVNQMIQKFPRLFNFFHKALSVWAPGYFIIEVIAVPKAPCDLSE